MKMILDKIELIHDWDNVERFDNKGLRAFFNSTETVFVYDCEGIIEVTLQTEKKGVRDKNVGYYNKDGKRLQAEYSDIICKKQIPNFEKFPPHTQLALKGIHRIIQKVRQPLSVTFIQELAADRSTK
jgi:hypothetical protein